MMERNSFSVLFFLKKTKLLKNGEASVCMRITVNNVRSETNIRKLAHIRMDFRGIMQSAWTRKG